MGVQASRSYYDAHAQSVNLTEITSSDENKEILQMLRDDDPELKELSIRQHLGDVDWIDDDYPFVLGDGDDLRWLGYFIGRNTVLTGLHIYYMPEDREQITALFNGFEQNRSITKLFIFGDHLGESVLSSLSSVLRSESCCLKYLQLDNIPLDDDAAAALADALKGNKSLTVVSLDNSDLSQYREQISILIGGIGQSRSIRDLRIRGDHSDLGESVLNSLSALLRSESCSLTSLSLFRISFSNDVAVALADALKGNKSLTRLVFISQALTSVGWSAFSRLLCDTSSVSNTYHSNHTLQDIGSSFLRSNYPQGRDVEQLLALNGLTDKHAAIQKILKYHPDLDVGPFLRDEWELKLLPLVLSWFVRVRGISEELRNAPRYDTGRAERIRKTSVESEEEIEKRQLSTMYNFVRGMPLVAIDGCRRYLVGQELQEPKVGRHTYRRYSRHKKEKLICIRLLDLLCVCLLGLCVCLLGEIFSLLSWGDFAVPSITLCVCMLSKAVIWAIAV